MTRQPSSGAFVDDALWPLLHVRMEGEISQSQHEEYLDRAAGYLRRGERHLVIMDASQLSHTVDWRRRQAEWQEAHKALLRETRLGIAFLSRSSFHRLAMRALLYLKPQPAPYMFASTLEEAVAWAAGRFEAVGHPLQAQRIREHYGLVNCLERSVG
jgi:hypothetical protein